MQQSNSEGRLAQARIPFFESNISVCRVVNVPLPCLGGKNAFNFLGNENAFFFRGFLVHIVAKTFTRTSVRNSVNIGFTKDARPNVLLTEAFSVEVVRAMRNDGLSPDPATSAPAHTFGPAGFLVRVLDAQANLAESM